MQGGAVLAGKKNHTLPLGRWARDGVTGADFLTACDKDLGEMLVKFLRLKRWCMKHFRMHVSCQTKSLSLLFCERALIHVLPAGRQWSLYLREAVPASGFYPCCWSKCVCRWIVPFLVSFVGALQSGGRFLLLKLRWPLLLGFTTYQLFELDT